MNPCVPQECDFGEGEGDILSLYAVSVWWDFRRASAHEHLEVYGS